MSVKKKNKATKPVAATRPSTSRKYIIRKAIVLAILIILALILYVDSQTGFIKSLVGDKTFEIRIRK